MPSLKELLRKELWSDGISCSASILVLDLYATTQHFNLSLYFNLTTMVKAKAKKKNKKKTKTVLMETLYYHV